MKAIDLSLYQTVENWQSVLRGGVRFAVLKASQGRYLDGSGAPFADPKFARYARDANDAGMPLGFYHFLCAADPEMAQEEAAFFLKVIAPFQKSALYVFLDCENYNNQNLLKQSRAQLTNTCLAFLRAVGRAGLRPALYTNPDHLVNYLDISRIPYPLWVAKYGGSRPQYRDMLLWQYGVGRVEGIREATDLNVCYIPEGKLALMRLFGLGYMNTPAYWIDRLDTIRYLDTLAVRCAASFARAGEPAKSVPEAIARLTAGGFINTPAYWQAQTTRERYIGELLCNLGGYRL